MYPLRGEQVDDVPDTLCEGERVTEKPEKITLVWLCTTLIWLCMFNQRALPRNVWCRWVPCACLAASVEPRLERDARAVRRARSSRPDETGGRSDSVDLGVAAAPTPGGSQGAPGSGESL